MLKRLMDIVLACILTCCLLPVLIGTAILVRLTSPGPAIYWSRRVGRFNQIFWMPKFRTMRTDTPQVATHLLADYRTWVTPIGDLLRRTSVDEFPQLWSILRGDMSFVGPRPALFNQEDLVTERTRFGVHQLRPGLTGWAQINGRDELSIPDKVAFDAAYLQQQSIWFDTRIILLTVLRVLKRDGVKQADDDNKNAASRHADRRAA